MTQSTISAADVRYIVGPIADHAIAEIIDIQPTIEDLEVAVAYAQGQGDVVGAEGHELSGKPARLFEILMTDDIYRTDEQA